MHRLAAAVNHHLAALAVQVAERGSQVDHGARLKLSPSSEIGTICCSSASPAAKKAALRGATSSGRISELFTSGLNRQDQQVLVGEPAEHRLAQLVHSQFEPVGYVDLVRTQTVTDHHAVGIAPAHVGVVEIHGHPVAGPGHRRLRHLPLAGHVVGDFKDIRAFPAQGQVAQLVAALDPDD